MSHELHRLVKQGNLPRVRELLNASRTGELDIGAVNNANRARPDVVGDWHVEHPRPEAWFNKAAFAAPRQFTYGSAGRNILRSQSLKNVDLSLFREDGITERIKLQFRGELFNTFNHPTFAIPQTVTTNLQFGQVSGAASTARQIQLGLKVLFEAIAG